MAKKMVLIDDLDGSEAEETVKFGIDGDTYEVDLNKGNAETLRTMLAPYRKVARPTRKANGSSQNRTPASATKARRTTRKVGVSDNEIRQWAQEKGIAVKAIGRVPKVIREQYLADN